MIKIQSTIKTNISRYINVMMTVFPQNNIIFTFNFYITDYCILTSLSHPIWEENYKHLGAKCASLLTNRSPWTKAFHEGPLLLYAVFPPWILRGEGRREQSASKHRLSNCSRCRRTEASVRSDDTTCPLVENPQLSTMAVSPG